MSEAKWTIDPDSDCDFTAILDESGNVVCGIDHDIDDPETKPGDAELAMLHAERIVRAVNSFDAMVAALEAVITECDDTFFDPSEMSKEWVAIYAQIRAALAQAKGE